VVAKITQETIESISESWTTMTKSLNENQFQLAVKYIGESSEREEIKQIQKKMEEETHIGQYATLCSVYKKLCVNQMKDAVLKALFGQPK
jgi:hypothetical protein